MKRRNAKLLFPFLLLLAVLAPSRGMAAARPLIVGLVDEGGLSKQEFAQVQHMLGVIGESYRHKTGVTLKLKIYLKKTGMEKDITAGKISFLLNISSVALKKGFVPFAAMGFFNEPENLECVYVRKTSPYKTINDLKGKKFATRSNSATRFFRLAVMLKQSPLGVFPHLLGGANDASLIYMTALGQVEGALIGAWPVGLAALTNPGPVKKLRRLNCISLCPPVIMVSPAVSQRERARFLEFLINLRNEKTLLKYRQLILSTGLVITPVDKEKHQACRQAESYGEQYATPARWIEDFKIWSGFSRKNNQL